LGVVLYGMDLNEDQRHKSTPLSPIHQVAFASSFPRDASSTREELEAKVTQRQLNQAGEKERKAEEENGAERYETIGGIAICRTAS